MSFETINAQVTSCYFGATGAKESVDCSKLPGLKAPFTCGVNIQTNLIYLFIYLIQMFLLS